MSVNDALLRTWRIPTTLAEREARAHRRIAAANPERAEEHLKAAAILDSKPPQHALGDYARQWTETSGKVPPPTMAEIEHSTLKHNEGIWYEHK